MEQKIKPAYLFVAALFVVVGFASMVAVAKNDNAKNENSKSDKAEKTTQAEETNQVENKGQEKTVNLKNFKKADETKGETNAKVHKEKTQEVVKNLEQVATQEELSGNTETSNQIEAVVAEQEQAQEETAEAIEEIEGEGKIKTFLVGTDYKNLGQLRSSLVQNRNQIRKLTQTMTQNNVDGDATLLQQQLETLMQERERIKTVITTNESAFSLFGWVNRFLNNYEATPINEEEETALLEEVEGAVETVVAETTETEENTEPVEAGAPTDETIVTESDPETSVVEATLIP